MSNRYINEQTGQVAFMLKGGLGVRIKGKYGTHIVTVKKGGYPVETTPQAYWRHYLKVNGFKEDRYGNR